MTSSALMLSYAAVTRFSPLPFLWSVISCLQKGARSGCGAPASANASSSRDELKLPSLLPLLGNCPTPDTLVWSH